MWYKIYKNLKTSYYISSNFIYIIILFILNLINNIKIYLDISCHSV